MPSSRTRKTVLTLLKIALAAVLLAYLGWKTQQNDSFAQLREGNKQWGLLALAGVCVFTSVSITIVRWMILVRALDLDFSLADALRLGFQGYALNFVSLGSVGGDLFKAVFIAREQHGRRTEAVATVVIDRLVGLYALFMVSSGAVLWGDLPALATDRDLLAIRNITLISTAVGGVCILLLLVPGFTGGKVSAWLSMLPLVGPTAHRLLQAIRIYRRKYLTMLVTLVMSLGVHISLAVAIWLIARGLPGNAPSLGENLLVVPIAALVGAVPITPSGLGAFEGTLDFLYQRLDIEGVSSGLIVALCFRVITILIALVGVVYLIRGRREVAEVMHEAQEG